MLRFFKNLISELKSTTLAGKLFHDATTSSAKKVFPFTLITFNIKLIVVPSAECE